MDIEQRFQAYASDFELAYADDDWSRVGAHFSPDASYDAGDGSAPAFGRDAILLKLKNAVDGLDRKMDKRDLRFHSVSSNADVVTANWTIRFSRQGMPTLEVSGSEVARVADSQIIELKSVIKEESLLTFAQWMDNHGDNL
ncbi:nuclear transport factor 2 family protein [Congregibacter variabilis]|uniref:Nuclear transport factor 2 family protein n=1 Tax=Congregibacter variabilis TaxID=3081200 RepID=A0ABZ0I2L8_9GAMM|nr:nuclear transport factor 2 family protein [Congregibacter sp. IMCC43200]